MMGKNPTVSVMQAHSDSSQVKQIIENLKPFSSLNGIWIQFHYHQHDYLDILHYSHSFIYYLQLYLSRCCIVNSVAFVVISNCIDYHDSRLTWLWFKVMSFIRCIPANLCTNEILTVEEDSYTPNNYWIKIMNLTQLSTLNIN